jgi:hypothetical protein
MLKSTAISEGQVDAAKKTKTILLTFEKQSEKADTFTK